MESAMRRLVHAFIVALVGVAILIGGAHAQVLRLIDGSSQQHGPVVEEAMLPQAAMQQAARFATVSKPFGATGRVAPSSDAQALVIVGCGDEFPVLEVQGGWVRVQMSSGPAWIGGGRVMVGAARTSVDCSHERFLFLGGPVTARVETGCLSLRARPSREAATLACVDSGHEYIVVDGPFDPGTGEDWLKVTSPCTGTGLALAVYLYPVSVARESAHTPGRG
jgi:hypothetical protein